MESDEIRHRPEGERRELVGIYENRGVDPTVARTLADEMMRTPELALETHAREELGINPTALGRPLQAAVSSFVTFALGALVPVAALVRDAGNRCGGGIDGPERRGGSGGGRGVGRLHPTELVAVLGPSARDDGPTRGGDLRGRRRHRRVGRALTFATVPRAVAVRT